MARPVVAAVADEAEGIGNAADVGQLGLVDVEFFCAVGVLRGPRVFEQRTDGGGGKAHAAFVGVHFEAGEDAQAVGIAFVGLHVVAFGGTEVLHVGGVLRVAEPVAQGVFAGVAEGRVAEVVG